MNPLPTALPQVDAGFQPYIGLKPFTEQEKDRFFGRAREISILLDKIRANRLTLLLAASGVGKSSLLQAGIMPALRQDSNIELIYHRDWAASPQAFKQAVSGHYGEPHKDNVSLKSILRACTLFSSGQQILFLDQFEEFFNYQRFRAEFLPFIEELSAAILDRSLPAAFVFSMREDFALELNSFKPFLPGVFDSYFRLEKLTRDQARLAIEEPLKPTGWRFEQASGKSLLEEVLNDLAKREQERQFGVQELLNLNELPLLVEPPHLQIVCQELWQHHRDETAKQITCAAYEQAGKTAGILNSYFLRKISSFNEKEQKIASAAFDHLIGQRATKIAHPLGRLSELTGFKEQELKPVLEKLQEEFILRRQQRDKEFWYELYHDIFSESIDHWNRDFKHRQRRKRLAVRGVAALIAGGLIFAGNNFWANYYGRWLQSQEGVFNRIEINRGTEHGWDVFGLRGFLYESPFVRQELEADKRFDRSIIEDRKNAQADLVGRLPLSDRLPGYARNGLYRKMYKSGINQEDKLAETILKTGEEDLINPLIAQIANIRTARILELLSQPVKKDNRYMIKAFEQLSDIHSLINLLSDTDKDVRKSVVEALSSLDDSSVTPALINLLSDENAGVRWKAAESLSQFGDNSGLVKLLADTDVYVRRSVVKALGEFGGGAGAPPLGLINLFNDEDEVVRLNAAEALGNLNDRSSLVKFLKDKSVSVRLKAAEALGTLGDSSILVSFLKEMDAGVRKSAVEALGNLGDNSVVPELIKCLTDVDRSVRLNTLESLGKLGSSPVESKLIKFLKDADTSARQSAAKALGDLGDRSGLLKFLQDKNASVRSSAAEALGNLGDSSAASELAKLLTDSDAEVRKNAAKALGKLGDSSAASELAKLLTDSDAEVRKNAAKALGKLGDSSAASELAKLLTDSDVSVRFSAVKALGSLGSSSDVVKFLKDTDIVVRRGAAEALGNWGDSFFMPTFANTFTISIYTLDEDNKDIPLEKIKMFNEAEDDDLLTLTPGLIDSSKRKSLFLLWQHKQVTKTDYQLKLLKNGTWKKQEKAAVALTQMNSSAQELQTWRQRAVNKAQEKFSAQNAFQRKQAAQLLYAIATKQAAALLVQLINDPNREVAQEAIKQTGLIANLHPEWINPEPLLALLNQSNVNLRRAAIKALGQFAWFKGEKNPADHPDDVEQKVHLALRTLVFAEQKDFAARQAAVDALGAAGRYGDELLALLNTLKKGKDDSLLRCRCLQWLGYLAYVPAKEHIENELQVLEEEKAAWRKERQKTEQNELKQQDKSWPKEHWEYMLGNALARIAPAERGIKLLGHPLHYVRQGAVHALAAKADAALIGAILQTHQAFDPDDLPSPFPYTAFQAIDLALWNLEYTGTENDLKILEDMLSTVKREPCKIPGQEGAIEERLEWTIERLKEKLAENTDKFNQKEN